VLKTLGIHDESVGGAFELLDRRDKIELDEFNRRAHALGLDEAMVKRLDEIARAAAPATETMDAFASRLDLLPDELEELDALREQLIGHGLAEWCQYDLGFVRGLAYYTGAVFEIHEASGAERAIAGGGRYDGLVEMFGGDPMPAIGFGMGDVVLGLVLQDRGLIKPEECVPKPDVFVISAGSELAEKALPRLVAQLRRAGIHARHTYKTTRNVGKLLGDASKSRARFAIILGNELADGQVALKDLVAGTQSMVARDEILAALQQATRAGAAACA
jgi:histidyl-tRNA synthetase